MWSRAIIHTGLVLSAISLAGCLIIPTDYYTDSSRQNTAEKPPETIIPGKTSREEVLLNLGEPDESSSDETELWYDAEKVKAWLIVGESGGNIIRHYLLVIRFDRNGVVESQRIEDLPDINLEYNLEPHFSKTPITLPVKGE
jgi:outer membrane protein assembly factor BamE (lipoprotein component of BamABCDE complex)